MICRTCEKIPAPAFTLLETLIALVLVGLILATLHSALWVGVRAYRTGYDRSQQDTMAWSAIGLMRQDIARLAPQCPGEPAVVLGVSDVGPGAGSCLLRMRTVSRLSPGAREMLVDYFFVAGEDGKGSMVRRSAPLERPGAESAAPADAGAEADARYEIVATELSAAELRYFDGRQWQGEWDSAVRKRPPKLIELTLRFKSGDGQRSYAHAMPVVVGSPLIEANGREDAQ